VTGRVDPSELRREAETLRREGFEEEALTAYERLIAEDLATGRRTDAVTVFREVILWKPARTDLHDRLAKTIAGAGGADGLPASGNALFAGIPADQLTRVLRAMRPTRHAAGTEIVREGDRGDSIYLITNGRVRVSTVGAEGRELELAVLSVGDFFGEISVLTSRPRTATVRAVTDVETLELARERVEELRREFPGIDRILAEIHQRRANDTVHALLERRPPA
jgi:hypothetical protein